MLNVFSICVVYCGGARAPVPGAPTIPRTLELEALDKDYMSSEGSVMILDKVNK